MTSFVEVRPFLGSADVQGSATWYRDVLGFEVGDPIVGENDVWLWVWLRRGPVGFMLNLHDTHEDDPAAGHVHPPPLLTGSLYINVDDVDALASEIGDKATLEYGPTDQPHGTREIALADPDGYLLVFGQPIS
ncbi:MAG: hypothetical protein V7636_436 [Actinomycetota bacterium]|jgi:catechol 2,3-dioxygenase-like lactoylglutathione lyase family enzyme